MQKHDSQTFDLTDCDREPIHLIGKIQPHGWLLILDKETLLVEQASENAGDFLGIDLTDILEKPIEKLLSPDEYTILKQQIFSGTTVSTCLITLRGKQFFGFIHASSGKIVLEGEPYEPIHANEVHSQFSLLAEQQLAINSLDTVEQITDAIVGAVQAITNYDRVVIFQFDQDWNAAVVAEKKKAGVHSFAGHHFPATDIPKPGRELMRVKPIRHIPDVKAPPVPIVFQSTSKDVKPLDLMRSELRYPSEIHLEYLMNMKVLGSLSISIITEGNLWGIISCSNEHPRHVNYWKRQLCDQLARACANKLLSSHEKRNYQWFEELKHLETALVHQIEGSESVFQGLFAHPLNLMAITEANGAALLLQHRTETIGITPDENQIQELVEWLSDRGSQAVYFTRTLSREFAPALDYKQSASGLLALEISRYNREYLLFFKAEINEKRIWAGEPLKIVGNDFRIHPRKSFEQWEELIKGTSLPWRVNEIEITQLLLKDIIAIRLRNQAARLGDLSEEYQASAEGFKIKNKQLEDFAHIITHNLRSPLSNIQALCSIYESNPKEADVSFILNKILLASGNMMATINDLYVILKTRVGFQIRQEHVDVEEIIEKEVQNLSAVILQTGAEISLDLGVKHLSIYKLYLESIFHNLLSNALKYRAPERKPVIHIESWQDMGIIFISVRDNGMGIDLKKYGSKLFGLYKTFHQSNNARGLGLYLTKMQVESMGGSIAVESTPGTGTTFTVALGASHNTSGLE
jgi:chemotaxis family two-component system sensor kinase Cph1